MKISIRKFISIILTSTMAIGLLPTFTLRIKAESLLSLLKGFDSLTAINPDIQFESIKSDAHAIVPDGATNSIRQ